MESLKNLGLSDKTAKIYLVALEYGESTITFLSKQSEIKRSTIYEFIEDLVDGGYLYKTQVGKKTLYGAVSPRQLLTLRRRAIEKTEDELEHLEVRHYAAFDIPKVKFYYGESGFKNIWFEILEKANKEYRIITNGQMFSGYVSENYLFDEIIKKKKKLNLKSKQLIVDSNYARRIVKKDEEENRVTRFLPPDTSLEFTQVITDSMVAFMSVPEQNFQFIVESMAFAHYQRQIFEVMWDSL